MNLKSGDEPQYPTREETPDNLIYVPFTDVFEDGNTGEWYKYVDGIFYQM